MLQAKAPWAGFGLVLSRKVAGKSPRWKRQACSTGASSLARYMIGADWPIWQHCIAYTRTASYRVSCMHTCLSPLVTYKENEAKKKRRVCERLST